MSKQIKILYAVQGTGNGHLSRARDIVPALEKKGSVDVLISGIQADMELPFPVKYKFHGLSFIFGKKGGIDLAKTYKQSNLRKLYEEIKLLPVKDYDLVISDFEPVSAWACKMNKKPCIGLSHQSAVSNKKSPKPKNFDPVGQVVLKRYAPVSFSYGFHFDSYDQNIFTPVIRTQIRTAKKYQGTHFTVYLPAYGSDLLIKYLKSIPDVQWQVFCKHTKDKRIEENVSIFPIDNEAFIKSFVSCEGILCGAGFETPAEALFMQKKLMVIPMKGQYEQQCNAAALKTLGIPVIKSLKKKYLSTIEDWTRTKKNLSFSYPDQTDQIIELIISNHLKQSNVFDQFSETEGFSFKKLKEKTLGKILEKLSNVAS